MSKRRRDKMKLFKYFIILFFVSVIVASCGDQTATNSSSKESTVIGSHSSSTYNTLSLDANPTGDPSTERQIESYINQGWTLETTQDDYIYFVTFCNPMTGYYDDSGFVPHGTQTLVNPNENGNVRGILLTNIGDFIWWENTLWEE